MAAGLSEMEQGDGGVRMKSDVDQILASASGIGSDGHPLETAPAIKPLTIWTPSQFLKWEEPPGSHLLLPAYVTKGELTSIIGQGGLGKTRLALWLAICQILHRPWCGLETGGEPQKWLFLGSENSVSRIKGDLQRILSNLSQEECGRVDEFLMLQAILGFEDADMNLDDLANRERIKLTVDQTKPGAIVPDPLVDFSEQDIAKPAGMKQALRVLVSTIRRVAPGAAIVALHHARTGRQNIIQSVGWDAANFASGGKTLFSMSRCQINLAPGSEKNDTRLVLSCAKANNCVRFVERGLCFDPLKFTYTVDPEFDVETWRASVEGRTRTGQSLCTVVEVVSAVQDGYATTKALVEHLVDAYATSKSSVERAIRKAINCDAIATLSRGKFILGKKSQHYLQPKT